MSAPMITCQAPAGQVNPCGRLLLEQISAASALGLCCVVWLARTTDLDEGEVDR